MNWELPAAGQRYGGFQAGVQLANRSGPLNEIEYSEYVVKTQAFADAVNATPEFPEMLEEVARARELRSVCQRARRAVGVHHTGTRRLLEPRLCAAKCGSLGFCGWGHTRAYGAARQRSGLAPVLVLSFDSQAALAEDPACGAAIRDLARCIWMWPRWIAMNGHLTACAK